MYLQYYTLNAAFKIFVAPVIEVMQENTNGSQKRMPSPKAQGGRSSAIGSEKPERTRARLRRRVA
jgi:hypothetical protein